MNTINETQITPIGEFPLHEDGTAVARFYKVPWEITRKEVAELFPAIRCEHSYDCCACWYPDQGKIIRKDEIYGFAIVQQNFYQNV